jgi:predicted negative regulator of RcsB-dependent stress response
MADFIKSIDVWFLVLAVMLLGGWFVWSVRNIFDGFSKAVGDLQKLIEKLFEKHADHESRLSSLEGRCNSMEHCGGRRAHDPRER